MKNDTLVFVNGGGVSRDGRFKDLAVPLLVKSSSNSTNTIGGGNFPPSQIINGGFITDNFIDELFKKLTKIKKNAVLIKNN